MKFYSAEECRKKSDQHSEMASLALIDGDKADAARHNEVARIWMKRAKEGGWGTNHG